MAMETEKKSEQEKNENAKCLKIRDGEGATCANPGNLVFQNKTVVDTTWYYKIKVYNLQITPP